jgi:hypothetical protein
MYGVYNEAGIEYELFDVRKLGKTNWPQLLKIYL